jgi:hypothetical protein
MNQNDSDHLTLKQAELRRKQTLTGDVYGWLEVSRHDVRLRVETFPDPWADRDRKLYPDDDTAPTRGEISEYTRQSTSRARYSFLNSPANWHTTIDLTYPAIFPLDGRVVKAHLTTFLKRFNRAFPGCHGWVLEFQRRGAPHYHLVIDSPQALSLSLSKLRTWVSIAWYEIVGSEDALHLRAGTRVDRIADRKRFCLYIAKYISKSRQKDVPAGFENVGRFWGMSDAARPLVRLIPLTKKQADRIRRTARKRVERKGRRLGWLHAGPYGMLILSGASWVERYLAYLWEYRPVQTGDRDDPLGASDPVPADNDDRAPPLYVLEALLTNEGWLPL